MTHKAKKEEQESTKGPAAHVSEVQVKEPELNELESLKKELGAKQKVLDELNDKFLRNQAENENFQKRMKKEQADFVRFATEKLINDLLPVMDDLERAIESAEQSKDLDALTSGVNLILSQLRGVLERAGLQDVQAKGQCFDPAHHEAVHMVETDDHQENVVVDELRKGYLLNDRVLRPSMVSVAKKKSD